MVFDHVSVEDLHNRLGIAESFRPPPSFGSKPLRDWRMETEDSLILRFIYRNLKPNRHLEFGTWTGAGARCVLDESEATVWTINLPSGEFNDDGRTVYHSRRHSPWSLLRRLSSRKASATIAYQSDALGHSV
jgi:hypothetical protein